MILIDFLDANFLMSQNCNTSFRIESVNSTYYHHFMISELHLKGNEMDFYHAVKIVNILLAEKRPNTFNSSWILKHAPHIYRYIQRNVRSDIGGIDWDKVTRALDRRFQRKWMPYSRNHKTFYREKAEAGIILEKYHAKLYAFIAPADKNDEHMRDIINIALVRIAQKGNILAKEEITKLVRFAIYVVGFILFIKSA